MALKRASEENINEYLQDLEKKNLQRKHFYNTIEEPEKWPCVIDASTNREVVTWCANSVLGLHVHKDVIAFTKEKIEQSGVGASGSRNISGSSSLVKELEKKLAAIHQKEDSVLFQSGWAANFLIRTLADALPNLQIYSDSENHNSIRTAVSAAKNSNNNISLETYPRHDMKSLNNLLSKDSHADHKLIVFEDIHSMDGSIAPLEDIIALAEAHNAIVFCDSTASFGLRGELGAGLCEEKGMLDKVDIIASTLGKAAGVQGGFIAANTQLTTLSRLTPTYVFTTANSIPNIAASLKAVEILSSEEGRILRKVHGAVIAKIKSLLLQKQLPFEENNTHIIPLLVGDEEKCKRIAADLLQEGIYVAPVFYPTVPRGKAMFRIMPSPKHTEEQIQDFVEKLAKHIHI